MANKYENRVLEKLNEYAAKGWGIGISPANYLKIEDGIQAYVNSPDWSCVSSAPNATLALIHVISEVEKKIEQNSKKEI